MDFSSAEARHFSAAIDVLPLLIERATDSGRDTGGQMACWNIFPHQGVGSDHRAVTDRDTSQYACFAPDPDISTNRDWRRDQATFPRRCADDVIVVADRDEFSKERAVTDDDLLRLNRAILVFLGLAGA